MIGRILDGRALPIIGKVLLCAMFATTGLAGAADLSGLVMGLHSMGLIAPAIVAPATVVTLLGSTFLIVTNYKGLCWLGAGALAVFTLLTIPVGHPFWAFGEPRRTEELHIVMEHLAVVGGLILAAIASRPQQSAKPPAPIETP